MNIEFQRHRPAYPTEDRTAVHIPTKIDGLWVQCEISTQALRDRFGLASDEADAMVAAFNANRDAIEAKAREKLSAKEGPPLMLSTADFQL